MDNQLATIIDRMENAGESPASIAQVVKAYESKSALKHVISMREEDRHEHPHEEVEEPGKTVDSQEGTAEESVDTVPEQSTTEPTEEESSSDVEVDPLEELRKKQEAFEATQDGPIIDTSEIPESQDKLTGYSEAQQNIISQTAQLKADDARLDYYEWDKQPEVTEEEPERPKGIPPNFIPANDGTGAWILPEALEGRLNESSNRLNDQLKALTERKQALEDYTRSFEGTEDLDTSGLLGQFDQATYDAQLEEYNNLLAAYKKEVNAYDSQLKSYNNYLSKEDSDVGFGEGLGNIASNIVPPA